MPGRLKLWLTPVLYRMLSGSVRLDGGGTGRRPGDSPVIFACLHRDMIPAILHVKTACPTLLVSRSPDGDILINTLRRHGYSFARGSTGKQGGRAFRSLLDALQGGSSVGIAVDGPRGPFGVVRDGVIQLSRLTGAPIVPLTVRCGRHLNLGNWDRTVLPLPFTRIEAVEGEAIAVPPD
ncbi:DUF374 domain-containing protein, partial [bacterium]|nr:DUF374 domain-containing protein [bacterium]